MFLHFPLRAYTTVGILLAISAWSYRRIKLNVESGKVSRFQGSSRWLLLSYVLLLLFLTVLGRRSLDYYRFNFELGYSYRDVLQNRDLNMALQIGANIAAFIPLGGLCCFAAKRWRFIKSMGCGIALSACIECLQLVLRNGNCEIDDLISNTLGTFAGCVLALMWMLIRFLVRKRTSEPQ